MSMRVLLRCDVTSLNEAEFAKRLDAAVAQLIKEHASGFYRSALEERVVSTYEDGWRSVGLPNYTYNYTAYISGAEIPPLKVVDAEPEP